MPNENLNKKFDEVLDKVGKMKKENMLDLSSDEDLSIAIMNLVSIEEHFFFTAEKTGDSKSLEMLNEVREMRKELLAKIVKNPEGEQWCISKHLLAASMRLMEVGTKALGRGKKEEAQGFFDKAFNLYSLFWGINMGAISTKDISKIDDNALNIHDQKKTGLLGKLGELVKKAIDCCRE
jgi:hypothetical protein